MLVTVTATQHSQWRYKYSYLRAPWLSPPCAAGTSASWALHPPPINTHVCPPGQGGGCLLVPTPLWYGTGTCAPLRRTNPGERFLAWRQWGLRVGQVSTGWAWLGTTSSCFACVKHVERQSPISLCRAVLPFFFPPLDSHSSPLLLPSTVPPLQERHILIFLLSICLLEPLFFFWVIALFLSTYNITAAS
jgi:hypothetical protein